MRSQVRPQWGLENGDLTKSQHPLWLFMCVGEPDVKRDFKVILSVCLHSLNSSCKYVIEIFKKTRTTLVFLHKEKEREREKKKRRPSIVVHACNPSNWEAEVGGTWLWGQPGIYRKFEASLSYITSCKRGKEEERIGGGGGGEGSEREREGKRVAISF